MKRNVLIFCISVAMVFVVGLGSAHAGEVTADVNADVSFLTDYMWRGQNYGKDGVIQPNLSIAFASGISLGLWGNYIVDWDVKDSGLPNSHMVNEVDYTVDYSFSAGPVGISLGWILYDFPRSGGADTQEVYAGISLDTILAPSLTVYRDIEDLDGTYATFSLGHDFELSEKVGLSISGTLGWGNEGYHKAYFGVDDGTISDYNLSISLPIAMTDKISVAPVVYYSAFKDDDIETAANLSYGEDKKVYGGLNVSYSF